MLPMLPCRIGTGIVHVYSGTEFFGSWLARHVVVVVVVVVLVLVLLNECIER